MTLAIGLIGCSDPDLSGADGAVSVCHQFVSDALTSPGSAEYEPTSDRTVTERPDGDWEVRGWVDSENAMGALVRSDYTCVTRHLEGEDWRLVDLATDESP